MPPKLILLIGLIFVFHAFRTDKKRGILFLNDLFWPTLWYLVAATRPIGVWMEIWGLPLPMGGDSATEGSPVDRMFYGVLTLIGTFVLSRRRFNWGETFRRNPMFAVFLAFMAMSICWSEYPFVSFKRYVKVLGSLVMTCIILSEPDPFKAFTTVIRRCLYVHLPMSIICTRWFREIGVSFDWSGTAEAWQGVSTTKNTLGQMAMLGVVYFGWEVKRKWKEVRWKSLYFLYLLMAIYLLKGAETISMTSVSVCVVALIVFLRLHSLRAKPAALRKFAWLAFTGVTLLISFVVLHSIFLFSEDSLFGNIITMLGRDITMTGRTEIWHDVYAATKNPLIGVGFGGFWIGRIMNIPWNEHMTWILGQGHSGYADTYLQLGLVGCFLLFLLFRSSLANILATIESDFEFACFRITLCIVIMFVNITESTYLRGEHHLWFIMQLVLWSVPRRQTTPLAAPAAYPAGMHFGG